MTEHLLTPAELTDVFERHMTRDFPQAELKPLDLLLNLQARGLYYAYLFREGEQDVGYALLVAPEGSRTVLLDYLAILPEFRCKGLGGRILARLQAACAPRWQALTLEVEHPAEAPDEPMAVRRLGFYARAGAVDTGWHSRVFGVHFHLLALPCEGCAAPDADTVVEELKACYRLMLPGQYAQATRFWPAGQNEPGAK